MKPVFPLFFPRLFMLLIMMSTILISSETAALRGFYSKPKNPTIKTSKSDSRHRQKTDGDTS